MTAPFATLTLTFPVENPYPTYKCAHGGDPPVIDIFRGKDDDDIYAPAYFEPICIIPGGHPRMEKCCTEGPPHSFVYFYPDCYEWCSIYQQLGDGCLPEDLMKIFDDFSSCLETEAVNTTTLGIFCSDMCGNRAGHAHNDGFSGVSSIIPYSEVIARQTASKTTSKAASKTALTHTSKSSTTQSPTKTGAAGLSRKSGAKNKALLAFGLSMVAATMISL